MSYFADSNNVTLVIDTDMRLVVDIGAKCMKCRHSNSYHTFERHLE